MIALIGLLTPYFITFGIYYAAGKDLMAFLPLFPVTFSSELKVTFSEADNMALSFAAIIIIMSMAFPFTHLNIKKIKSRKIFSLLIWVFLISVAVYFIMPSVSVEIIWITAIPVSYFLTHYFIFIKKKLVAEYFSPYFFLLSS